MPTLAIWVRDFMRISPSEFQGSKMENDPVDSIDEAYHIITIVGVPSKEKAKLVAYQLKGLSKISYE